MSTPRTCLICQRIMKQYEEALLHGDRTLARDILRQYDNHRDLKHRRATV